MLKPDAFAGGHAQRFFRESRLSWTRRIEKKLYTYGYNGVAKTPLIDHYAGVIDSMSKGILISGKNFLPLYCDGPHTMPMEVSLRGK